MVALNKYWHKKNGKPWLFTTDELLLCQDLEQIKTRNFSAY